MLDLKTILVHGVDIILGDPASILEPNISMLHLDHCRVLRSINSECLLSCRHMLVTGELDPLQVILCIGNSYQALIVIIGSMLCHIHTRPG